MSSPSPTASYWCYSCTRFVQVHTRDALNVSCPFCYGGFIEEIGTQPHRPRRSRRADGSPFNPVIVLRGGANEASSETDEPRNFELYYDDGSGSGLRPLPPSMSEFLMGSGFATLLEQLSQIEITGLARPENPPASKSAIESMPTIDISEKHVLAETHCAVCKEEFQMGTQAKEMPCKHIYHEDCILPWLAMRNSCPVCRHELPAAEETEGGEEETVGLTIWRLPGGGFAVGRFSGGVYTEMDGGFGGRRVSWRRRERERGNGNGGSGSRIGIGRVFRTLFSSLGRGRNSSSGGNLEARNGNELGGAMSRNQSSLIRRYVRRSSNRGWILEDDEQIGDGRW